MIWWRGLGFLAVAIPIVICLIVQGLTKLFASDPNYYNSHNWVENTAFGISSVLVTIAGFYFNVTNPTYAISPESGYPTERRLQHTFMFVPLQYWGVLIILLTFFSE